MKPLYHGTIYDFDEIDVSAGKGYKDFGKGFYATAVHSHAERLAIRNKSIAEKRQSFLKNKKGIKIQPIVAYRYNLLFSEETAGLKVKVFEKADKVIAELKPENLPKQYFFRTKEAVNTLSFDKVKRQVIG